MIPDVKTENLHAITFKFGRGFKRLFYGGKDFGAKFMRIFGVWCEKSQNLL